jgi:membrane protease YdiL (CAAX protease family)
MSVDSTASKGLPSLAWLVILGVVAFLVWRNATPSPQFRQSGDLFLFEVQARYMVGAASLFGQGKMLYEKAGDLDRGPYGERLRFAILAGELAGPAEARRHLERLRQMAADGEVPAPTPEELRLSAVLECLYQDYEEGRGPDALPLEEQAQLRKHLGWFGDLALAPANLADEGRRKEVLTPAKRTALGLLAWSGGMAMLAVLGLVLGVVLFVFWATGRLRTRFRLGSPAGGIYAESFAVYLALFVVLGFAFHKVEIRQDLVMLVNGLCALLAGLLALVWPVLRGVPWRQVRADVGWTSSDYPAREVLVGVGCYLTALPLVIGGIVVFLVASYIAKQMGWETEPPGHPLVGWVRQSGWWVRLQVAFDACVVAPLVEETMFRGVLYRHLREATAKALRSAGVVVSAAVVSLLFAAIHPQGLLFVPVLAALAFAFCLAREWRGSLIAPMVAHGLTNGITLLLLLFLLG